MDSEALPSKANCTNMSCLVDLILRNDESIFLKKHGLYRRIPKAYTVNWKDGEIRGNIVSKSELLNDRLEEKHKGKFSTDWNLICRPDETLVRKKNGSISEILEKFGVCIISVSKFKNCRDEENIPLKINYDPCIPGDTVDEGEPKNLGHSLIQTFNSIDFIANIRTTLFDENKIAEWVPGFKVK